MALLEFYRANVKYFFKILYHIYKIPFTLFIVGPAFLILFLNFSNIPYKTEIILSLAASILVMMLVLLLGTLWKFAYITGYSMRKELSDTWEGEEDELERYGGAYTGRFLKFLIFWLLVVLAAFSLLYFKILM